MPVLRGDMRRRPEWCELESFDIVALEPAEQWNWNADHAANKLVVASGTCRAAASGDEKSLMAGDPWDALAGEHPVTAIEPAVVVALGGRWGDDCGGVGIFRVDDIGDAEDGGDPVWYEKRTGFDRHFHDCDEYWIMVSGRGTAVTEDQSFDVGPGDCVATRMGDHHDFPSVSEPVLAVYFETTMRGQRRRGHLWEHTHGPAKPS